MTIQEYLIGKVYCDQALTEREKEVFHGVLGYMIVHQLRLLKIFYLYRNAG